MELEYVTVPPPPEEMSQDEKILNMMEKQGWKMGQGKIINSRAC